MSRARKRSVSLLVVLAMLATMLFAFAGTASAATTYTALSVPPVSADGQPHALGTVEIKIDSLAEDSSAVISLPPGFDFRYPQGTVVEWVYTPVSGSNVTVNFREISKNEATLEVDVEGPVVGVADDVKIYLRFPGVIVPQGASGDITLTIEGVTGQLPDGKVVIGTVGVGEVALSVADVPTMGEGGATITINVRENAETALRQGSESLKLKLPPGFSWEEVAWVDLNGNSVQDANEAAPSGYGAVVDVLANSVSGVVYYDKTSDRDLILICNDTTGKGYYRIVAKINPTASAKFGDVTVTVGGASKASPASLVVAKYGDYGVTVKAESTPELIAGRLEQKIGTFVIEENIANSLVKDRTVTITLPAGAKWVQNSALTNPSEQGVDLTFSSVSSDGRTVTFKVYNPSSGKPGKVSFKDVQVNLAVDFTGDLTIEFGGSAGAGGKTITVAKVIAPITAQLGADKPAEVKIGLTGQPAADIVIKENAKGALLYNKVLEIDPGPDVSFAAKPTVTVTEGDLEIKGVTVEDGILKFTVKSDSTTPSTIRISNIKYKVDRTVVYGDIVVKVKGTAVDEVNDTTKVSSALFPDNRIAAKVVNATVVTPAPEEVKVVSKFTVNSTSYTVGGETKTMDVAPFKENGRVYLPVRYAAYAVGVSEDAILWDAATRTATFIKGDRVVQLTANSNKMLVNGAIITMDVPAKVVGGRMVVPIRWVGIAFGCAVDWDADTQTVTITR